MIRAFKCTHIEKSSLKKENVIGWKPPPNCLFKLNVDGVLFDKIHKAGVGVVLRNGVGNVIMAMSKIKNGVDNADDIEAVAALSALQLVFHSEVSSVILEGGSMWVVDVLKPFGTKYVKTRSSIRGNQSVVESFQ